MNQAFAFKLKKSSGPAGPRLGEITTARGVIDTPVFMPVGTYATVKTLTPEDLQAFVTNGRQGINYRRGTWHLPLIAFEAGQEFLVIDRAGDLPNCDEHVLDESVLLLEP